MTAERSITDEYATLAPTVVSVCREVAFQWNDPIDPEDLASEIWIKLVKIDGKGRLDRDLRIYGWPANGWPDSVKAVIRRASRAWAGGICSDRRLEADQARYEKSFGPAPTRDEVYGALVTYRLLEDSYPPDLPLWVERIALELPYLTDGELRNLERWYTGSPVNKSNVNKAADKLIRRVVRAGAKSVTEYEDAGRGVGSKDGTSLVRASRDT